MNDNTGILTHVYRFRLILSNKHTFVSTCKDRLSFKFLKAFGLDKPKIKDFVLVFCRDIIWVMARAAGYGAKARQVASLPSLPNNRIKSDHLQRGLFTLTLRFLTQTTNAVNGSLCKALGKKIYFKIVNKTCSK